ncbi:hypothetical protein SeLEV6574_g05204 [Synchytrium endobioticum]|nr:hypothetical protein SeLEV6574_g05204 [Synchytrium endobioticum]
MMHIGDDANIQMDRHHHILLSTASLQHPHPHPHPKSTSPTGPYYDHPSRSIRPHHSSHWSQDASAPMYEYYPAGIDEAALLETGEQVLNWGSDRDHSGSTHCPDDASELHVKKEKKSLTPRIVSSKPKKRAATSDEAAAALALLSMPRSTPRKGVLRVFKCSHPTCDASFTRKWNLLCHQATHNPGRTPSQKCAVCDKLFYHKKDLTRHMKSQHHAAALKQPKAQQALRCGQCTHTSPTPAALRQHVKTCGAPHQDTPAPTSPGDMMALLVAAGSLHDPSFLHHPHHPHMGLLYPVHPAAAFACHPVNPLQQPHMLEYNSAADAHVVGNPSSTRRAP